MEATTRCRWRAAMASASSSGGARGGGRAGLGRADEHVGGGEQGLEARHAGGIAGVDHDAALAAVAHGEEQRVLRAQRVEGAGGPRLGDPSGGSTLMTSAPRSLSSRPHSSPPVDGEIDDPDA